MCFARDKFTSLQEGERESVYVWERERSATMYRHPPWILTRNVSSYILWDFFASHKVVSKNPLSFLPVSGYFSPADILKNQQCSSQSQLHTPTPGQRRMDINTHIHQGVIIIGEGGHPGIPPPPSAIFLTHHTTAWWSADTQFLATAGAYAV